MIKANRILNFQKLGIGLFVHYGPSTFFEQGEWSLHLCNIDNDLYEKTAREIDCSTISFDSIIEAAKTIGAKYITFTTRHHDGFSLYDTKGLSNYDIMHSINPKDIVKEFVEKCKKNDILPILYHTTLDWRHPAFKSDFNSYLEYLRKSVEILCTQYGEIGGLWFDGNWSKPDADWKLNELYSMIRKYQKNALIIDNIGLVSESYLSHNEIDIITYEQGIASKINYDKIGKYVAGEVCFPLNEHWGIANDINFKSVKDILKAAINCRRYRANLSLGITVDKELKLSTIQKGLLEECGKWIKSHEELFYNSYECQIESEGDNFALKTNQNTYYFIFPDISSWGDENVSKKTITKSTLFTNLPGPIKESTWMEDNCNVEYEEDIANNSVTIENKPFHYGMSQIIRVAKIHF